MEIKFRENGLGILDGPWLRRQVENHLVFGPISRNFGFGWIIIIIFTIDLASSLASIEIEDPYIIDKLLFIAILFIFLRMSTYHQAAIGWCLTKFLFGMVSLMILIVGGLFGYLQNRPDAVHAAVMSLVWLPGVEFIPRIQPKQKIITGIRLFITPILLYYWFQTGTWR